jgi:hypothetical protein
MYQDLTGAIERVAHFEQHFGIEIQSTFAYVIRDEESEQLNARVAVNGELRACDGQSLPGSIQLVASLHDASGRVLAVLRDDVHSEGFHGFQAFSISDYFTLPAGEVAKVKLYPQGLA